MSSLLNSAKHYNTTVDNAQYRVFKCLMQCCGSGSGSTGSTCFWASWIRILILLSLTKNSKKNLDFYCFFLLLLDFFKISILLASWTSLMKMQIPDPLVRGMDPRIRIRTKMSWIRSTGLMYHLFFFRHTFRRILRRRRTRRVGSSSGSVTRRRCWCSGSRPTQPDSTPTTRNGQRTKIIVYFKQTCCLFVFWTSHIFLLSKISHSSDEKSFSSVELGSNILWMTNSRIRW